MPLIFIVKIEIVGKLMKQREQNKLIRHFDYYFGQNNSSVLHSVCQEEYHVDVLKYEPNEKYPFYKLVTMGASDYKLPKVKNSLSQYNEYIMFVDKTEDLSDKKVLNWYLDKLMIFARFAYDQKINVSYGHSFEWTNQDQSDEMIAGYLTFPQVIDSVGVLWCKVGMFKTVTCLQTVLLNKEELEILKRIGNKDFDEYLYSEDGKIKMFLSERKRSQKF